MVMNGYLKMLEAGLTSPVNRHSVESILKEWLESKEISKEAYIIGVDYINNNGWITKFLEYSQWCTMDIALDLLSEVSKTREEFDIAKEMLERGM